MRSLPSWCAVRKILVSVTIGEDLPGGNLVSQITLDPGPKTAGRGPSSATPVPFGPRNRVQSDALAAQVKNNKERIVFPNGIAKDYPIGGTTFLSSIGRRFSFSPLEEAIFLSPAGGERLSCRPLGGAAFLPPTGTGDFLVACSGLTGGTSIPPTP